MALTSNEMAKLIRPWSVIERHPKGWVGLYRVVDNETKEEGIILSDDDMKVGNLVVWDFDRWRKTPS